MIKSGSRYLTTGDTKYIKHLYRIASILGTAPPYDFETNEGYLIFGYKIYAVLLVVFLLLTSAREVSGQAYITYSMVNTPAFLLETILNSVKTCVNVMSILQSAFCRRQDWIQLLRGLFTTNSVYACQNKLKCKCFFIIEMVLGHILVWSYIFYDGYVWTKNFGWVYQYYTVSRIQYYYIMVSVLFICNFSLLLKYLAEYLNKALEDSCKNLNPAIIDKVSSDFTNLTCLVETFNRVFGCRIFLIMGITLAGLLEAVNFVLMYSLKEDMSRNNFASEILVLSLLQGALLLAWVLFVIIRCDETNKELEKTSKLCYQLLRKMPGYPEETKKLEYLAQESAARCPQITAGTVFDVRIAIFFALIGSLTSYVIVLIPFSTNVP